MNGQVKEWFKITGTPHPLRETIKGFGSNGKNQGWNAISRCRSSIQ
jgi:hypothetical protein